MKNRQFKKNMKKKFASLKEGQGLITGNTGVSGVYHSYKLGDIVDVIEDSRLSKFCFGNSKYSGIKVHQYIRPEHILVK